MFASPEIAPPAIGLLAIDTSTDTAGIALSTPLGVVSRSWPAGRSQTTTVLPEIDRLLNDAGLTPADITGLVVAIGPGTFTGLRVGLAIAKGIVAASGVPLVGIPTLDIVLAANQEPEAIAVLPAGRGRVVWQRRGSTPVNGSIDELIAMLADVPNSLLIGEVRDQHREEIASAHTRVLWQPRNPEVLLQLGSARIAAGDPDDAATLEPVYLHGITVAAAPIEDRLRRS